ncbi:hypothetical protein JW960_02900 [candidate division KSB1 bacterium]|nr:hypothetical protein [candidate division KSB1 bacterium]
MKLINYEILVLMGFLLMAACHPNSGSDGLKSDINNSGTMLINQQLGPAPGSYQIDGDENPVTLPFEFYGMNLMVKAQKNGLNINMLIDNGVMWDELFFYGSDQVDSLGMKYEGNTHVVGAGEGEGIDSYTASDVAISFGKIHFSGQSAVITAKEHGFADYFPGVAGQVCGAFFKHFIVEFNFDDQTIKLHKPDGYKYTGNGTAVQMTRDSSGAYSIPVNIKLVDKSQIDYRLFIDLGGIHPASLVISEKYGISKPLHSEKTILGYGASGEINGYKGLIDRFKIEPYELNNVAAVFTEADNDGDHTNTTIGLALLKRFNLVFDYFHEKLYIEPNSHFNDPYIEL